MGSVRSRISIPKKLTVIIISNEFSLWIINYGSHIEINYWVENSVNEPSLHWVWDSNFEYIQTLYSQSNKNGASDMSSLFYFEILPFYIIKFLWENDWLNVFSDCSNSSFIFHLTIISIKSKNNSEKMKKSKVHFHNLWIIKLNDSEFHGLIEQTDSDSPFETRDF